MLKILKELYKIYSNNHDRFAIDMGCLAYIITIIVSLTFDIVVEKKGDIFMLTVLTISTLSLFLKLKDNK